jgi:cysteine peptidase C11 family protein
MSWGVLAYIVADDRSNSGDSLDEVAETDLERLLSAAERAKIPIAAQIDYQGKSGIWRQVLGATKRKAKLREADSSRAEVLKEFLHRGLDDCPADHYIVMLWGHGSGPGGFFSDASRNTPARDGGHPLNPRQLANALKAVAIERAERAKRGNGGAALTDREQQQKKPESKKFEVVLLKACFAATAELALELEPAADFIIASQNLIPGQTFWPYPRLFQHLSNVHSTVPNNHGEAEFVAEGVLDILGHFYGNDGNRPGKTEVPYSLLKTAKSEDLKKALSDLVNVWRRVGAPNITELAARCCPGDPGLLDLPRFCETLIDIGEPNLFAAATKLRRVADAMVIGRNPEASAFRGLSLFYHPGYGVDSPARDSAPYGLYKRSSLADTRWAEIAFQNMAIAKLAHNLVLQKESRT